MAHEPTEADKLIANCLLGFRSFSVVAGAGSGKTTSLVSALQLVRDEFGRTMRRDGQKVACITYTKRACAVITARLDFDPLFDISTIHSFLWMLISRYVPDIRMAVTDSLIPNKIEKYQEQDNGGQSQRAKQARQRIEELGNALTQMANVPSFEYDDRQYSDFSTGKIGHDDVIELAALLISSKPLLRSSIGQLYPYIFVDEAQDTFAKVITAFNTICEPEGLPIVGYFGDPMQQIFETGAGTFAGPSGYLEINKKQNFRSAKSIVKLANTLRSDIQQEAGGQNAEEEGSVRLLLVEAENPLGPRNRYTDDQLDRALQKFDAAIDQAGWEDHDGSKRLYLVHQMIARRLGFLELHRLFTGAYASSRAQDEFQRGAHFLLKPFLDSLCPIMKAAAEGDERKLIEVFRDTSPAFDVKGENRNRKLKDMLSMARKIVDELTLIWNEQGTRQVLKYAREMNICVISDRLGDHLDREPKAEEYDSEKHSLEKSDWLADEFFTKNNSGLLAYAGFLADNTAFSTQHGVKGEQYDDVLVTFDDTEAGWHQYNFTKLFIPGVVGQGTPGQQERSRKLAYVCFTRAKQKLLIILFCPTPIVAKAELVQQGLFLAEQVTILEG